MSYHAQRPAPKGKLVMHHVSTPVIEVAGDGKTARGQWIMSRVESGLTSVEVAKGAPDFMYEKELVDGKKVWMQTLYAKYGADFIKQDGAWKIWHFHCFEVARAPLGTWIRANFFSWADRKRASSRPLGWPVKRLIKLWRTFWALDGRRSVRERMSEMGMESPPSGHHCGNINSRH